MFTHYLSEKIPGLKPFRYRQITHAIFVDLIDDWSQASTLPAELREVLAEKLPLQTLQAIDRKTSNDGGTTKILFSLCDGQKIETVLMRHKDRNTVCVSSQVGCPVGCVFCATGRLGFVRNLTWNEIIDQIIFFAREIKKESNGAKKIDNIVFMGMGEPMLNLDNVIEAVRVLIDEDCFGLSKRKITISTSGYIKPLRQFLQIFPHISLAISLHAPNQELRAKIMPTASRTNDLNKLIELTKNYSQNTNRRVSYEYILLADINDDLKYASELYTLLTDHLFHVNLIPYNPDPGNKCDIALKRPNTFRVNRFKKELNRLGVPVSVRVSMGADISAACGQLKAKSSEK